MGPEKLHLAFRRRAASSLGQKLCLGSSASGLLEGVFCNVVGISPAEKLKKLRAIEIDNPVSAATLADYIAWWPTAVLPARQRKVTVLCMDGHEKTIRTAAQRGDSPPSRGGRPRSNGKVRPFNNGWFMVTSLILATVEMKQPEHNGMALASARDLPQHLHQCPCSRIR